MLTFCHSCHAARRLPCRPNVPKNGPANGIFLDFHDSHFNNNLIISILILQQTLPIPSFSQITICQPPPHFTDKSKCPALFSRQIPTDTFP